MAQPYGWQGFTLEHLMINDGLAQNYIECIFQDSRGFLWFGTWDGLVRYDCYQFKVYSYNSQDTTSISTNDIRAICEDAEGNLWIGTAGGGLNQYDRTTERFVRYQHDPHDPYSLSHNDVYAIHKDRLGTLWVGTAAGLCRLSRDDRKNKRFTRFVYAPEDSTAGSYNIIYAMAETVEGNLWLGVNHARRGLIFFDRATKAFAAVELEPAHPERYNWVRALHQDEHGNLWVGAFSGLFQINLNAWQQNQAKPRLDRARVPSRDWLLKVADYPTGIYDLCQDDEGKLWLASTTGLFIYDRDKHEMHDYPYRRNNSGIIAVCKDRSGVMWVGTAGQGIDKLKRTRGFGCLAHDPKSDPPFLSSNARSENSLSSSSIRSICEDRDSTLWIGSYGGLDQYDRKTKQFKHYPNRSAPGYGGEVPWAIYEDPLAEGEILWIGTEGGGLYRFDRKRFKFLRYQNIPGDPHSLNHNFVLSIHRDQAETLWIGTLRGLNKFDEQSEKFTPFNVSAEISARGTGCQGPSGGTVLSICESHYGSKRVLWLATENGLNGFDLATEQFAYFQHDPHRPKSLSHNSVYCLHQDRKGRLWIGTASGLNRLFLPMENQSKLPTPEEATFIHYSTNEGLPHNLINGILEDDAGCLWLSTNKGISRFDPETKVFRNYDVTDGLQNSEFNRGAYHQCRHGEMFFGGISGLNMFFPAALKDNPHPPPVVLTDFKLFNQPVVLSSAGETPLKKVIAETEAIRLSYKHNVFSFEFAALEYTAPQKNQYAYKLEGYGKQWIHLGTKRDITFTNLDPGEYVFRVKGSNNDGVWNEQGTSLKIIITPPWWQTWWAYVIYVVSFVASVIGLVRWRFSALRNKAHELETIVVQRTNQVVAQKNQLEERSHRLLELDGFKSRFFANISHEFRTPLTLILGPIETLLARLNDRQSQHELKLVRKNAANLLRLVNQLLDLARLESGRVQLKAGRGDLIACLKSAIAAFESLAKSRNIEFHFQAPVKSLEVWFNRDQLETAFCNLLSNAFKFTPDGGKVSVAVETYGAENESGSAGVLVDGEIPTLSPPLPLKKQKDFILITIKDTGIGIPTDKLPNVFDRFYQAESASTRKFEGTGIGLSLVKELVELHDGKVEIRSEPGQGTEVLVWLPLGKEHLKPEEIVVSEHVTVVSCRETEIPIIQDDRLPVVIEQLAMSSDRLPVSGDRLAAEKQPDNSTLILVVEDNADMRAYIRQNLALVYRVLEAENGVEGVEKALGSIPDLVISDVMMPKMDGYQLCDRLKTDERTSHIPVILLTARAEQKDKLAGLETGADDYLTKPFDANELLARIKNLIALRRNLQEKFQQQMVLRPGEILVTSMDEAFLKKAVTVVEAHLEDEAFSPEDLANEVGMSRAQFYRKMRALTDQPAGLFIRSIRLQRAADLIKQGAGNITEIAYKVGFSSQPYFSKCFQEYFGVTPKEYKLMNC